MTGPAGIADPLAAARAAAADRVVAAAVDVGSNSVHLLVGSVGPDGLEPLIDESALLGLGDVVDATGHLVDEACDGLIEVLLRYAGMARAYGAQHITLLGTEPIRRTSNQAEVVAAVRRATGEQLHVLRHEDEALLTLLGVTGGEPAVVVSLVVDIGGGSSEYVLAVPGDGLVAGALPTGSARLTASLVAHDPPTVGEITALRFEAARLVAATPSGRAEQGVMVGGTATNLVKVAAEPSVPDPLTFPDRLDHAALDAIYAVVAATPADEIALRYFVNRRRAGMLAAGAALVEAFMQHHSLEQVSVSRASLREGAILARERGGDAWLANLPALCVAGH